MLDNNERYKNLEIRIRGNQQSSQKSILNYVSSEVQDNSEQQHQELQKRIKLEDDNFNSVNNQKITDFFVKERINTSYIHKKIQKQPIQNSVPQDENQISNYEKIIQEKDQIIDNLHFQLKNQEQSLNQKLNNHKTITKDIICQILIEKEDSLRKEKKLNLMIEKTRIGEQIISRYSLKVREGSKFQEIWVDGWQIRNKKQELQRVRNHKEQIQTLRSNLSKKKTSEFSIQILEEQSQEEDLNISQQKNKLAFQSQMLQKEEEFLLKEIEKLATEKIFLIRNQIMLQEEECCRFAKQTQGPKGIIKPWPLINQRYQFLSLLGKGGYSEVYKAYDFENFRYVACKVHQLLPHWSASIKSNYIKHAIRENDTHQGLNHPNIVKDYDTIEIDDNTFMTVLEYCSGPDLSLFLKQNPNLPEKECRQLMKQILQGIKYLHEYKTKIIHYDLKPQNIIFHNGEIKITDFGLCKLMDQSQSKIELTSQGVGTYWYLPPECFEQQAKISPKVDVWSIGVIFFEMLYNQKPFGHNMSQQQIMADDIILKANQVNFPINKQVSNEAKEFIRGCLKYNQEERWEVNQALNFLKRL